MTRALCVVLLVCACGGNDKKGGDAGTSIDGPVSRIDSNTSDGREMSDGGSSDAPACTANTLALGDGAGSLCSFDVNVSFDPATINIVLATSTTRDVVCHILKQTGCGGDGWYWNSSHQITLCAASCNQLMAGGGAMQVKMETGCATSGCVEGSCVPSGGACTFSTAYTCCSGRCDGDSCGTGLWGPCSDAFGCFEGQCQNGFCRCATGDLQCGAECFDPMTSSQHCGTCGNTCTGGKACEQGTCTCPSGMTDCNGTCVDLTSSMMNCGMCGHACNAQQTCTSSQCLCPTGQYECNGVCVNITDPMHCGTCTNACDGATETCTPLIDGGAYCACNAGLFDCNGTCVDRLTDENNCGTCGHVCPGNKQCVNGSC